MTPVSLTCDADTETCATPPFTVSFSGVSPNVNDTLTITLTSTSGAERDTQTDDDTGTLSFGSWNRRLVSLIVVPTPGAPAETYDATAEVLIELTAGATVPLDLGMDTEPVGDPCCEEACCCPPCAKACQGAGCGGTTPIQIISLSTASVIICPGPACDTLCAIGANAAVTFSATCDPGDCVCRSETITLQWSGLSLTAGAEVFLNLQPAEGALPELQTDDDMITQILPGPIPTVSAWGFVVISMLLLTTGTLVLRTRSVRA